MVLNARWCAVASLGLMLAAPPGAAQQPADDEPRVRLNVPAPSFALPDDRGRRWRLGQAKGTGPVVLWFADAATPPQPWLDLAERYRSNKVQIVAVVSGKTEPRAGAAANATNLVVLRDRASELTEWYRIRELPRVVLLDRALIVRWMAQGSATSGVTTALDALLAGRQLPKSPD